MLGEVTGRCLRTLWEGDVAPLGGKPVVWSRLEVLPKLADTQPLVSDIEIFVEGAQDPLMGVLAVGLAEGLV